MFSSNTTQVSDGGYQISRSLRFNSADTTNLNRTFASAGNRRTFTLSFWLKRSRVGVNYEGFFASGNGTDQIRFENIDQLRFSLNSTASGDFVTTQVFRDVSAWYHIVFAVDTTQATSTNRVKIYVNGSQITSFTTASYPTLNYDCNFNSNVSHRLGIANDTSYPFNGYMTETYLIDGQALAPSSFGQTDAQTGVWTPIAYSGSYGTNGFYLNFSDNSNTTAATLGKDYSGNGNNWTPNNFSVTAGAGNDSLVDSPTSYGTDTGAGGTVRGNYATWNPIGSVLGSGSATNGNLDVACADSTTGTAGSRGTIAPTSGKWYFEVLVVSGGVYGMIGVSDANKVITSAGWGSLNAWTYYGNTGYKYGNGTDTAYGATYTTGDLIGVAYDSDAGTLTFYKNGTSQGQAFTGLTGKSLAPYVGTASGTLTFTLNAGQRPFAYTAPSVYKALCTQNLPTPTIGATTATQAGKYFNPVLYTGTGSSLSVTGVGFQPDWVWVKSRSAATDHGLYDAVRGVQKQLESNNTGAETTETTGITSFGSDGFTTGSLAQLNTSSATYVAWNWKANGSGSTNTAGQITSTVSANTTSGFSIVTFTTDGTTKTVGHGLGVKPSLIIAKVRNGVGSWIVMTDIINGSMQYGTLNTANAFASIGYSAPTSTVFQYNDNNGNTQVAYCFASIEGYSKFGSYTGNGSADGPFVYTGMRPAFLMIKRVDAVGEDWFIYDTTRSPNNANNLRLEPNLSDAEVATSNVIDFLSNGFKLRNTATSQNSNGINYIFAAFASAPFKFALAR